MTSEAPKMMSTAFMNFRQGKHEILKEYLANFNMLMLEIKDLNKRIMVHQIIVGLHARHFSLSLAESLQLPSSIFLLDEGNILMQRRLKLLNDRWIIAN